MKKPSRKTMILIAVVLVAISPLLVMALYVDDWSRDLTTNVAWTDPENPELSPIEWTGAPLTVNDAIDDFVETRSNWTQPQPPLPLPAESPVNRISTQPVGEMQFHLVRTTGVMRYRDDVWLVAEPVAAEPVDRKTVGEPRCRLHVHSQSRVGKGDLGQNPRNIRELLDALREAANAAPGSAGG
ncbi:MAG: DUF1499 domain-containing protein [Planctomycetota bacterium]